MKFHLYRFNGCQLTEGTRNSIANDQRKITPKISKAELWFLCMTHRLIVLYKCVKFHSNSFNGCHLTERTRSSIANDKCMEFQPHSFNSVQLTERTRNCIYLCNMGNNLKNINARVMVHVPDTPSQCALQMYEVSLKYL